MDSRHRSRIPLIAAVVVTTAGLLGAGTAVSVLATRQPDASAVAGTPVEDAPPGSPGPSARDLPTAQAAPPPPPTPGTVRPLLQRQGSGQSTPATGTVLDISTNGTYRIAYAVSSGCARAWWMIEVVSDGAALHRDGWFISGDIDPASGSLSHHLTEGTYHVQVVSTVAADSSVVNADCTWSYAVYASGH